MGYQAHETHLVSDPVVEKVKDEGPNSLEVEVLVDFF